jgi:hypothetical protein
MPGNPSNEITSSKKEERENQPYNQELGSKDHHIRCIVAGNPNTSNQVLAHLAEDNISIVRRHVAENSRTPIEILKRLAFDTALDVRLAVAENSCTPPELLARLASDSDLDVRYGVAEIPHIPMNILAELARDENPYVRCRALRTLRMLSSDLQLRLKLTRGLFFA